MDMKGTRGLDPAIAQLMDSLDIGMYITSPDGGIVDCNDALVRLMRIGSKEELIAQGIIDLYVHPEERGRVLDLLESGQLKNYELQARLGDGEIAWVRLHGTFIDSEDGRLIKGIVQDITAERTAKEEVARSEEAHRRIFEQTFDGIIIICDGVIVSANPMVAEMRGEPLENVIGMDPLDMIHPDDRAKAFERIALIMSGETVKERWVYRAMRADGKIIWIEVRSKAMEWQGEPALQVVLADVTEAHEAKAALEISEERYENIVQSSPMGMHMYSLEHDGRLVFIGANRAADEILGVSNSIFIGKTIEEAFPPLAETEVPDRYREAAENGKTWYTEQITYKDDSIEGAFEVHAFQTSPGRMVATFIDITERKRSEKAVAESEERIRSIIEHSNEVFFIQDKDHNLTYVTERCLDVFGYTQEEMLVKWTTLTTDAPINEVGFELTMTAIETGERQVPYVLESTKKDGTIILIEVDESPMFDENGQVVGLTGAVRDVTEKVRADQELRNSEERWRSLTESSPDHVLILDRDLLIEVVNRPSPGLTTEQLIGKPLYTFVEENDRERVRSTLQKVLETGSPTHYETVYKNQEGTIHYESHVAPRHAPGTNEIVGLTLSARDITERYKSEGALRESEEKFRIISEQSIMGIAILQENKVMYVNKAAADIIGYPVEELVGLSMDNVAKMIHPDDVEFVMEQARKKMAGDPDQLPFYHYRLVRSDDRTIWVDQHSKTITYEGKTADLVTLVDMTERRETETALKESEERFRFLSELTSDYAYSFKVGEDGELDNEWVTEAFEKIMGYTRSEVRDNGGWEILIHKDDMHIAMEQYERLMSSKPSAVEYRMITKDGAIKWVRDYAKPVIDSSGTVIRMIGAVQDITDRREAMNEIRESQEMYRRLVETTPDAITVIDPEGRIRYVSPQALVLYGYDSADELIGLEATSLIADEDRDRAVENGRKIMEEGFVRDVEYILVKKDGTRFFGELNATVIKDADGNPESFITTTRNITDRKVTEEALQHLVVLESLISTISTTFINIATTDIDDNITDTVRRIGDFAGVDRSYVFQVSEDSKRLVKTHDWTRDGIDDEHAMVNELKIDQFSWGLERLSEFEIINLSDLSEIEDDGGDAFKAMKTADVRSCIIVPMMQRGRLNGFIGFDTLGKQRKWMEEDIVLLSLVSDIIGNALDRKKSEIALLESEYKYRNVVDKSLEGMYIVQNEEIVFANEKFLEMFGYGSVEEVMGKDAMEFVAEESRELVEQKISDRISGQTESVQYNFLGQRKDGSTLDVETLGSRIIFDGKAAVQGVMRDITETKRVQEALAAEKERLTVTLRNLGEGVITTDFEGEIVLINKMAETILGWEQNDAIHRPLSDIITVLDLESKEPLEDPLHLFNSQQEKEGYLQTGTITTKGGHERVIEQRIEPLTGPDGSLLGMVMVFSDVTVKRQMAEEISKAEKLESVGVLAGGIAHDFNNLLTGILGNIAMAKLHSKEGDYIHERMEEAEKVTMRAKDLTQQLLTFSKGGAPIKSTASVGEMLKDTAEFALRGSNVRCDFTFQDDLWSAEIDKGQISQVINNLVINADQAMPEGGKVHIHAENVEVKAEDGLPLAPGRYVKIDIEDNGIGIAETHLANIFDPYFTTKQKGSGLGLASTYSIIKKHDGHVSVRSQVGWGTNFTIYLPASTRRKITKKVKPRAPHDHKGKVLIMDDEVIIREVATELLEHLGYDTHHSEDGAQAIEMFASAHSEESPFDLVILDLTVPGGMGGLDAITKIREIDPEVKAIVSSGYYNDPVMGNYREYGFDGVIAKPYNMEILSKILGNILRK